jgi:Uma2 family endonuclease
MALSEVLTGHEAASPAAELPARHRYAGRMSAMPARHVVTVDEFERMGEAGVFGDARVELLEGAILDMSPIGNPHEACVDRLTAKLVPVLVGRAIVRVQGSIRLGDDSLPQPDLALLRPRDDYYANDRPGPADVLLVIEVADTSVRYDRWAKLPLYGKSGVAEAWVIDVNGCVVDVAAKPSPEGYGRLAQLGLDDPLAPSAFPDVALTLREILGVPETRPST